MEKIVNAFKWEEERKLLLGCSEFYVVMKSIFQHGTDILSF